MKHPVDPSQHFLKSHANPLLGFFNPKSVAIVGSSKKAHSVGNTLTSNLIDHNFKGKIYPINPKHKQLHERKCYPSLSDVDAPIDLAIIITPAKTVPDLVKECVDLKIPSVIIISAGFKEMGKEGQKLEDAIMRHIKGSSTRIIGPNCLGLMNPHTNLNASFAADMPIKGNLAFISQSGAMCTAILDWSLREKIGFSSFVSIGSMADVGWGDLIDYCGQDEKTDIILLYMESIGDARNFLSAAKKVALTKPIILIKAGRTEQAAQAAASHTGSLAGSDDAFNSVISRVGAMRVESIADLFAIAQVLAKQVMPKGPNLTIVTNAGGPGVLATDETIFSGASLTKLSKNTIKQLNEVLPAAWSHANPVDILGDATAQTYADATEIVMEDPNSDGTLVILTPQSMTDPTQTARILSQYAESDKPLYTSWMGGDSLEKGIKILHASDIPNFEYPDRACQIFGQLYRHQRNLKALYETPHLREGNLSPSQLMHRQKEVDTILSEAKRPLLTEYESKKVLEAYGIPTVKTEIATTKTEAGKLAEAMGFPVVVKLNSETITHKTDVGGVKLNLQSKKEVEEAFREIESNVPPEDFGGVTIQEMVALNGYEILLGSNNDPQFGPILVFGTGGSLVEVFKDRSLNIPPLNSVLAHKMMAETKIYEALKGVRGNNPVDFQELERLMVVFSQLIIDHPKIKECDINPLLVSSERIVALDARFILHEKEEHFIPSALRPYPHFIIERITLKNGKKMTLRPIRPEDEKKATAFHQKLSENTVRSRFLKSMSLDARVAHDRLVQVCCIDYDREMRIVAENDKGQIEAVGSYRCQPNTHNAEFKLIVSDQMQGKGLGKQLIRKLIDIAKQRQIQTLFATVLDQNHGLLKICESLNFTLTPMEDDPSLIEVKLDVNALLHS